MILKSITFRNAGPFLESPIQFEPDITVITGANDSGKSVLLRLLSKSLSKDLNTGIDESDVNSDYLAGCREPWDSDQNIVSQIVFSEGSEGRSKEATAVVFLAPKKRTGSTLHRSGSYGQLTPQELKHYFPSIVSVASTQEGVRQHLLLNNPNSIERRLIRVAFGPEFNFEALHALSDLSYQSTINRAEETLNVRLRRILPPSLNYRFRFQSFSDKRDEIFVNIVDNHGAATGLSQRGTGIQTLINLLGSLALENLNAGNRVLLTLDEPETHLHADAQHSLRSVLEELGKQPNVQIVYTTHSACFINAMRPRTVRLLQRSKTDSGVFSKVDNSPYGDGFFSVRSSLGISPADSLLFAPVTVLVEGKTEVLVLPILLNHLARIQLVSHDKLESALSQVLFLEAVGVTNIPNLVRISSSHGSKVVAFIDGDQTQRWKEQLRNCNQSVPLIECPQSSEFEELLPKDAYFLALREAYPKSAERLSLENFSQWEKTLQKNASRLAFTKKIDRWLTDELGEFGLDKPSVMRRAAENIDPSQIQAAPLLDLFNAISIRLGE